MKHKFLLLYSWFVWLITYFMPDMVITMRIRGWLYSMFMKQCGNNFQVASSARLFCLQNLSCGRDVYIASNVIVSAVTDIDLEDEVMIGIGSVLISGNHSIQNGSYRYGQNIRAPIKVGFGSWIGGNTTLVAGSILPPSSLLAAGSVLNKKFIISGIYAGSPAKLIKEDI